jgi:hypothetical protein
MGVFDSFRKVFRKVLNFGNGARNFIKNAYKTIKKIPVIGNIVDNLTTQQIPFLGISAQDIAGGLDKGLNVANDVSDSIDRIVPMSKPSMPLPPVPNY